MCLGGNWTEVAFTVVLFQEWGGRNKILLEQVKV